MLTPEQLAEKFSKEALTDAINYLEELQNERTKEQNNNNIC